jgi:hypothetical protein
MTREYAEGLRDLKQATSEHFQEMIPALEKALVDSTIVVRPHQVENPEIYRQIASGCERVHVINEGNVVPWLMACKVLIHKGCTTSVEAFAMAVPPVSYRVTTNDDYDYGFYRLPNMRSQQCFNFEELQQTLKKILCGELGVGNGDGRQALIERYLAAQKGSLAYQQNKYPEVPLGEVRDRVARFQQVLRDNDRLNVEQI